MKENEANFLSELITLIGKYNVTFEGTEEPVDIYVDDRRVANIVEKDGKMYL